MGRSIESFHGFCGQTAIVGSLREHCSGALAKGTPLPHICLMGPSGMGKTELAKAVSKEMGTTCHSLFASPATKRWQIAETLKKLNNGDILFLDEIHALPDAVQEILYPAIDRLQAPVVDPQTHRITENEWVQIPPFTLISATDLPGKLRNALRQRLVLRYTLGDYTEKEMRVIVGNRAAELGILLSPQAASRIGQAALGTPRRARHILHSLHTCLEDPSVVVSKVMANKHLASIGIDKDNLNGNDRAYLAVLGRRGGFVSLETLAMQLGLDDVTLKREVEIHLTKRELVSVDSRGRSLTEKGKQYVEKRGLK